MDRNKADLIVGLTVLGLLVLSNKGVITDPQTILKFLVGVAFLGITLRSIAKYSQG